MSREPKIDVIEDDDIPDGTIVVTANGREIGRLVNVTAQGLRDEFAWTACALPHDHPDVDQTLADAERAALWPIRKLRMRQVARSLGMSPR